MASFLGLNAKIYNNSGSYASPTWDEITGARDVGVKLANGEAAVSSRGSGGWKLTKAAMKDASVEFDVIYDPADTEFQALRDAWINGTAVELAVMDSDVAVAGAEGIRASFAVIGFDRNEPLEGPLTVAVVCKPTESSDAAPAWFTST